MCLVATRPVRSSCRPWCGPGPGGIGQALVTQLAKQFPSATLILADENRELLDQVAGRIERAEAHAVDATQPDQVESLVQGVLQHHKNLDAVASVVGNVMMHPTGGNAGGSGQVQGPTLSDLHTALNANLVTAFNVLQASTRAMSQQASGGSIVLTSAAVAEVGLPGFEVMSAAKAGVDGLVRSAAASYAHHGVRINAVAPGLTRTLQTKNMLQGDRPQHTAAATHPLKQIAKPEDIACALTFLLHPGPSCFITGQVLAVDGGLTSITEQKTED